MSASNYSNGTEAVSIFIEKLEPSFAILLEEVRQVILNASDQIDEHIKWNSPAFFFKGEMPLFNPKEYKRDLIVIHTRREMALLVFPTGANIDDSTGILEGDYADGRRMITIRNSAELKAKKSELQKVIVDWLKKTAQ